MFSVEDFIALLHYSLTEFNLGFDKGLQLQRLDAGTGACVSLLLCNTFLAYIGSDRLGDFRDDVVLQVVRHVDDFFVIINNQTYLFAILRASFEQV